MYPLLGENTHNSLCTRRRKSFKVSGPMTRAGKWPLYWPKSKGQLHPKAYSGWTVGRFLAMFHFSCHLILPPEGAPTTKPWQCWFKEMPLFCAQLECLFCRARSQHASVARQRKDRIQLVCKDVNHRSKCFKLSQNGNSQDLKRILAGGTETVKRYIYVHVEVFACA